MSYVVCPCCASPIEIDGDRSDSNLARLIVCDVCETAFEVEACAIYEPDFSLVCGDCDAGTEIASVEAARVAGWTDLQFAPDLPMANWLGVCLDCRSARESA